MEGLQSTETSGISALVSVCLVVNSLRSTGQQSVAIDNDENNCITDSDDKTLEEEYEYNN